MEGTERGHHLFFGTVGRCSSKIVLTVSLIAKHGECNYTIVRRETGYESRRTSKAITKLLQFILEGPQPCTLFSFT